MKKSLFSISALLLGFSLVGSASESSLRRGYERQMKALKTELVREIPQLSEGKKSAYFSALQQEEAAAKQLKQAQARMGEINKAKALVGEAKNKLIAAAKKGLAKAKGKLDKARTYTGQIEAKKELAKWEKNLAAGEQALKERTANYEKFKGYKPKISREIEKAKAELAAAKRAVIAAINNMGLLAFLADDRLDGKLARYVALKDATPQALAKYAAQSREHEKQVEAMLASDYFLIQMAVADGPRRGRGAKHPDYGRMLEIYSGIQKATDQAAQGPLRRLALAIALEHAAPHKLRAAKADTEAPTYIDPVKRYLQFEKAFLNGELDPHFKDLTAWDMRMVVDGSEPDEILVWGREMLRNYRPDHITTSNHRWRYVALTRTEIPYGREDTKYDKDELQFMQNILMNGGVCGRRAFIGRFILRAFGNPTAARPQRGHAALVRWTPNGWVPVLGATWGSGWTKTPYDRDRDFLATTQARALGDRYLQVKRAHWIGDLMDEPRVWGLLNNRKPPEFWNSVALYTQRGLIAYSKELEAVGEELSEADVSDVVYEIETAEVTDADRKIRVDKRGVITIPAAATSKPKSSGGRIRFMPSVLGGLQLHYRRTGREKDFEYTIDAPKAGPYALVGKIVTPSWQQHLVVSVNGEDNVAQIALPHTVGLWDYTQPIQVELKRGKNVLRFSHKSDGKNKGFSIKEFQLTPVPRHVRGRL